MSSEKTLATAIRMTVIAPDTSKTGFAQLSKTPDSPLLADDTPFSRAAKRTCSLSNSTPQPTIAVAGHDPVSKLRAAIGNSDAIFIAQSGNRKPCVVVIN